MVNQNKRSYAMYMVKRFDAGDVIESNNTYTVTLNQPQYAVVDEEGNVVLEHNRFSERCLYCMSNDKASIVGCAEVWNSGKKTKKTVARRV